MKSNDKIYRKYISAYRSDGMQVYLPTSTVYFNSIHLLFSCSFHMCPFYGITCNQFYYSV